MNSEPKPPSRLWIGVSLALIYVVWGSTYFAIRIGLTGFPPLTMPAIRFLSAGSLLYGVLRLRGAPTPTRREWGSSAIVGTLLLSIGNGGVVVAEQWVPSGLAAIMIASVPVWAAVFSSLFGRTPSRWEVAGLFLGTAGVFVLNLGQSLRGAPLGAAMLMVSAASWAFGSVMSRRLTLPKGAMAAAAQMLCGGTVMLIAALVRGERLHTPRLGPVLALAYLAIFGSIVAYSAYSYLLRTVSPSLATSYAFVNPLIAVLLGTVFLGEPFGLGPALAMGFILGGVFLVVRGGARPAVKPAVAPKVSEA